MRWIDGFLSHFASAFHPTPEPAPAPQYKVAAMISAINLYRVRRRLKPLPECAPASAQSQWRAERMAAADMLVAGDSLRQLETVISPTRAGSIHQALEAWMSDPVAILALQDDHAKIGAGTATAESGSIYWCLDFL